MSVKVLVLLALTIPALCHGFLLRDQKNWNGLKATWGVNPFSPYAFTGLPRTEDSAKRAGWVLLMSGQTGCTDNPKFLGTRYWKDNDKAIVLIYDPAGYIAGIQAGVHNVANPNNFPNPGRQQQPMILEGDTYYITAYFVNPATLCNGRSHADYVADGTGTGLWIQNGSNPITQSTKMPSTVGEADASMWTKGSCFISMGLHYWYDLNLDMSCSNFFPVFLLYNEGVLNAFGWAFLTDITSSKHLEHPPASSYGTFMNPPPTCLSSAGTLTTLHIYLTDRATADLC